MQRELPVIFGEVLFDRFPDGSVVLGGAPFNVAWHLTAFGQAPLLVSAVGNDALGRRIRDAMLDWGMDTSGLQLDSQHPTGSVDVSFDAGEPRYDIVADRAYDHIDFRALPPFQPAMIYHGTLALRQAPSAAALTAIQTHHRAPVFLDINLRPPWWNGQILQDVLNNARWIKLNAEELGEVTGHDKSYPEQTETLFRYPGIEVLIITRGGEGAEILTRGGERLVVEPATPTGVVDTVGAGDAFASTFILGLLHHWSLDTIGRRAQEFASAIVQVRGATLEDRSFYRPFLERWEIAHS